MAENGYLVSGSADELAALSALAGSDPPVRAVVGYTAADNGYEVAERRGSSTASCLARSG